MYHKNRYNIKCILTNCLPNMNRLDPVPEVENETDTSFSNQFTYQHLPRQSLLPPIRVEQR